MSAAVNTISSIIWLKYSWLAASPDGLVDDLMCDTPEGIVELKNPYTARDMQIQEAVKQLKDFCLKCDKGLISLRTSHNYYYQVQATMRETGVISSYVPKRTYT